MTYWYIVGAYLAIAAMTFGFKSALSEEFDSSDWQPALLWPLLFLILLGGLPVIAYRAYIRASRASRKEK
jgi:uncharacterized membrane protein YhaH (DUF805 family)